MRTVNLKIVPVLSTLVLATIVVPYAHAGCGLYSPVAHAASLHFQIASPRLLLAALTTDDDDAATKEPSIVGLWKQHLISEGNEGIEDGTEVDASYVQWHSDGTEMQVSGMRLPLTGDTCLGVWIKTGARTYQLNHFGVSFDPTGQILVGPARLQAWLTLDAKGNSSLGRFTLDQWDEAGNLLAHVQGKVTGTRVTMETGFQPVE
ncbi:MAG: hypothetical protein WA423_07570 [Candidatus Sulfotelmatobacter sp.]